MYSNAPSAMIARLKQPSRPTNAVIAKGRTEGNLQMLLSPRKNDLTPLLGRQKVGYGTVVDGFARFQALNFGISGPEIFDGFSF